MDPGFLAGQQGGFLGWRREPRKVWVPGMSVDITQYTAELVWLGPGSTPAPCPLKPFEPLNPIC